jgi:hypothetical protein
MQPTQHDLAAYKRMLEGKIKALQFIGTNLSRTKRVTVEVTLDCGSRVFIEQNIIPFNLDMEMRTLVDDSIDHYQRMLVNVNAGNYEQI